MLVVRTLVRTCAARRGVLRCTLARPPARHLASDPGAAGGLNLLKDLLLEAKRAANKTIKSASLTASMFANTGGSVVDTKGAFRGARAMPRSAEPGRVGERGRV